MTIKVTSAQSEAHRGFDVGRQHAEVWPRKEGVMIGNVADALAQTAVAVELTAIFIFERDGAARLAYDNFTRFANLAAVEHFLAGTYVLSPYFQAFKNGLLPTACRIRDLPQELTWSERERGKRLFPHVSLELDALSDEICVSQGYGQRCVAYLLMRSADQQPFSDEEFERIAALAPRIVGVLGHLIDNSPSDHSEGRHTRAISLVRSPVKVAEIDGGVDAFIDDLFPETLSPREQRVVQLTLQGNSVDTIGLTLAISPHTVRVHLRNAYAKLRVRNRLELIGLFVKRAGLRSKATGNETVKDKQPHEEREV